TRTIAFSTVGPPAVLRITCAPHPEDAALCNPDDPALTVELRGAVPTRALARAVVIEPPAAWNPAEHDGDDPVHMSPIHPALQPGAHVRVRAEPARGAAALADVWAQRLAGAAAAELRFANRPAGVVLGIEGTYWSPRARHDLPVSTLNVPSVHV